MSDDMYGPPSTPGAPPPFTPAPPAVMPPPPQGAPAPWQPAPPPLPVPPPVGIPSSKGNWKGIVSLILACLGGGVLGLAFGISGYQDSKRGTATNGKMALWGAILNVAIPVVLFGGIAAVAAIDDALSPGADQKIATIAVGDCMAQPGTSSDDILYSEYASIIPCDEPHWGQAYYRDTVDEGTYPGDDAMWQLAEDTCLQPLAVGRIEDSFPGEAFVFVLYPSVDTFTLGDRLIVCVACLEDDSDFVGDHVLED